MEKIILSSIFVLCSLHALAETTGIAYATKILRVTDGDTVVIPATYLPSPLKKEMAVRIYGVDTPEKGFRAKCEKENTKGLEASTYTKKLVASAKVHQVVIMSWDKYGGRILGDILLDGISLRKSLIDNGYAREYFGEAKQSWCN
jgi:micrococcal nuclease